MEKGITKVFDGNYHLITPSEQPCQLYPEFVGLPAISPFLETVSASRGAMLGNMVGQTMVVVGGGDPLHVRTGIDEEYAKVLYQHVMPEAGRVLFVKTINPETADGREFHVIYVNENNVVNYLHIKSWHLNHPEVGFRFNPAPGIQKLYPGAYIEKGEIFMRSPNLAEDGEWRPFLEPFTCFNTDPASGEDAYKISESFAKRLSHRYYNVITARIAPNEYFKNLYGDANFYQPFPRVGEKIRDDGLVMCTATMPSAMFAPAVLDNLMTQSVDYNFDHPYNAGPPGGKVVSVTVHHDSTSPCVAPLSERFPMQYHQELVNLYRDALAWHTNYEKTCRISGQECLLSPELKAFIRTGYAILHRNDPNMRDTTRAATGRALLLRRQDPIGAIEARIVVEHIRDIAPGDKLSDIYGGKGVVSKIVPDSEMPIDDDGNRAEVIAHAAGTVNRQNAGRLDYQIAAYIAHKHESNVRRAILGDKWRDKSLTNTVAKSQQLVKDYLKRGGEATLRQFLEDEAEINAIYGNGQDVLYRDGKIHQDLVVRFGSMLYGAFTILKEVRGRKSLRQIRLDIQASKFMPKIGKLMMLNDRGEYEPMAMNGLIAPVAHMWLDKLPEHYTAASVSLKNTHGTPTVPKRADQTRFAYQFKGVRAVGEAEGRGMMAYAPGTFSTFHDRTNSPHSSIALVRALLDAPRPTNIHRAIDRKKYPLGTSAIHAINAHLYQVSGIQQEHVAGYSGIERSYINTRQS